ncbi:MAG: Hsp20/alpha crystallin family protein [Planctomycetes bacterium]|nr:Hsp20/alpha crystallin family protein [Planctomycetota bacterium]
MNLLTPLHRRPFGLAERSPMDLWLREFFDEAMRPVSRAVSPFVPVANVAETDKEWLVTMELPGMTESDVDVRLSGNEVVVTGERKHEKETKDKHFHRVESTYGAFERRFELPPGVRADPASIQATFQKGLLELRVAKVEARPVAKIPVRGA